MVESPNGRAAFLPRCLMSRAFAIGVRSTFLRNLAVGTGRARFDSDSRNVRALRTVRGAPYKATFRPGYGFLSNRRDSGARFAEFTASVTWKMFSKYRAEISKARLVEIEKRVIRGSVRDSGYYALSSIIDLIARRNKTAADSAIRLASVSCNVLSASSSTSLLR